MGFLDYLNEHEQSLEKISKSPKKLEETQIVYKKTTVKEVKKETQPVVRKVVKPTQIKQPEVNKNNNLAEHASAILDGIRDGDFGGHMYSLENQQKMVEGKSTITENVKQETRSYANDLLDGIPDQNPMMYVPPVMPMPQYQPPIQPQYQQPQASVINENKQEAQMPQEILRMMDENRRIAQMMASQMPPQY